MEKNKVYRLLGGALFILFLILYLFVKEQSFEQNSVYTIGKVTNWEAAEQGSTTYYDIYFHGKIYKARTSGNMDDKIGRFYFIRILIDDPTKVGKQEGEVPSCIFNAPLPPEGWKEKPKCK
jgi:hypothetical protein